ncbi:MAG: hypothetical protein ACRD3E_10310 [Terriglobales bacterium]
MFDLESISSGEAVPPVAPSDLAAVIKLMKEIEQSRPPGPGPAGIASNVFQSACSPGADVMAVWFRATNLLIALKHGEFAQCEEEGKLKDDFLGLWATFPFRAVDVQQDGSFHLNGDEFNEALRNLNAG